MIRLACTVSLFLLPGLTATAQSSGFREGEVFLYSTGLSAPGYNGAGILRVDPVAGTGSVFVQTLGGYSANYVGGMAFDPYRQRLVFSSAIGTPYEHLWFADGQGNVQNVTAGLFPAGVSLPASHRPATAASTATNPTARWRRCTGSTRRTATTCSTTATASRRCASTARATTTSMA